MEELITLIRNNITNNSQILSAISKHAGSQEYKMLLEAYGIYMEKHGSFADFLQARGIDCAK